jgi:hypothetical protein
MTSWPSSCIACCPDSLMHSPEDETRKYYFSCLNKVIEQRGTAVLNEAATGMYAGMAWDGQGRPATCFADKGTGNLRICCAMSGGVDLEKSSRRASLRPSVYTLFTLAPSTFLFPNLHVWGCFLSIYYMLTLLLDIKERKLCDATGLG